MIRDNKGFTNHALMGAVFLGFIWLAVFIPQILPFIRNGGFDKIAGTGALFIGAVLSPIVLFVIDGDEIFGFIGIASALFFGWISKKTAMFLSCTPQMIDIIRLYGAAFGPVVGFTVIKAVFRFLERRSDKTGSN